MSGRRIQLPKNLKSRPTTNLARESLFNILMNRYSFSDIKVLDLFSGTGAISYEFASLGCQLIYAIDSNQSNIQAIHDNCTKLDIYTIKPIRTDAFRFIKNSRLTFDLVFADPPFDLSKLKDLPTMMKDSQVLSKEGLFILEHGPNHKFDELEGFSELRKYGKVHFSFFRF